MDTENYYCSTMRYNSVTADVALVEDYKPIPTGLYNVNGVQYYKAPQRIKMGFDLSARGTND